MYSFTDLHRAHTSIKFYIQSSLKCETLFDTQLSFNGIRSHVEILQWHYMTLCNVTLKYLHTNNSVTVAYCAVTNGPYTTFVCINVVCTFVHSFDIGLRAAVSRWLVFTYNNFPSCQFNSIDMTLSRWHSLQVPCHVAVLNAHTLLPVSCWLSFASHKRTFE